jgi:hypothetical protein
MGYTTDFSGSFEFDRPLTTQEKNYITRFSETRRMKRDVQKLYEIHKGKHGLPMTTTITPEMEEHIKYLESVGYMVSLTPTRDNRTPEEIYGVDGGFFVGAKGHGGQDHDGTIIEYNTPPNGQPGLWCQWTVDKSGTKLKWDGGEKFYSYVEWLQFLIDNFFSKWGVILNGEVEWQGEDAKDIGKIVVTNNEVKVLNAKIVYE